MYNTIKSSTTTYNHSQWRTSVSGWAPGESEDNSTLPFIEVDMGEIVTIEMIKIQGSHDAWIESFALAYSSHEDHDLEVILGLGGEVLEFPGLSENVTSLDIRLQPFQAQIIRLEPIEFHNEILLKWQLFGCGGSGGYVWKIHLSLNSSTNFCINIIVEHFQDSDLVYGQNSS